METWQDQKAMGDWKNEVNQLKALSIKRHPDKYRLASMRGSEEVRAGHVQLRLADPAENCGGVVANFPARRSKLQRNRYEERLRLCGKGEKRGKG